MRDYIARPPQVCLLGSADPGSDAYSLSGEAGEFIASLRKQFSALGFPT